MKNLILAIDQGTTSSRAIIFDSSQAIVAVAQKEFSQIFPKPGWVEHNPKEILQSVVDVCREAMASAQCLPEHIKAIGITNQRETTIIWDKETGEPVHNAIVWQDRRTAEHCEKLKQENLEPDIRSKTGLLLDPYFSGTKIAWILDHIPNGRDRARAGELAFGTVDSFLIWHLSKGQSHVTDATNASRTMCFDISTGQWDKDLLAILNIPHQIFPEVKNCADEFGFCHKDWLGAPIPILGVAGDQQAATMGQACFKPGMMKSTYGTGCFALLNTGATKTNSNNRLLSTIAYQLKGQTTYALEGSIFIAGAAVQWLRDGLGIIEDAAQSGQMAMAADKDQDVIMVPAFTGLGAPYWNADARGAVLGLSRNTGPREIARAALESVAYQTRDLYEAMIQDQKATGAQLTEEASLRVDGGMSKSDWTMQYLADVLNVRVDRPSNTETTAMGAAWLAGNFAGIWPNQTEFAKNWQKDKSFDPAMATALREHKYMLWKQAVKGVLIAAQA